MNLLSVSVYSAYRVANSAFQSLIREVGDVEPLTSGLAKLKEVLSFVGRTNYAAQKVPFCILSLFIRTILPIIPRTW
jgi:hypothetical protein